MYIYIYIYMYIYMYIYTYVYIYIYLLIFTYVYVKICVYKYVYVPSRTHTLTHTYSPTNTHRHGYTVGQAIKRQLIIYIFTCICMHLKCMQIFTRIDFVSQRSSMVGQENFKTNPYTYTIHICACVLYTIHIYLCIRIDFNSK